MYPRAVSTTATSCPRDRSAPITCTAEAIATSRSDDVPPVRTVIFIKTVLPSLRYSSSNQLLQDIIPAHDPDQLSVLEHQRGGTLSRQYCADPVGRGGGLHFGERGLHHL